MGFHIRADVGLKGGRVLEQLLWPGSSLTGGRGILEVKAQRLDASAFNRGRNPLLRPELYSDVSHSGRSREIDLESGQRDPAEITANAAEKGGVGSWLFQGGILGALPGSSAPKHGQSWRRRAVSERLLVQIIYAF